VIGPKGVKENTCELQFRATGEKKIFNADEILQKLQDITTGSRK